MEVDEVNCAQQRQTEAVDDDEVTIIVDIQTAEYSPDFTDIQVNTDLGLGSSYYY